MEDDQQLQRCSEWSIWVVWDDRAYDIQAVFSDAQYIHCQIMERHDGMDYGLFPNSNLWMQYYRAKENIMGTTTEYGSSNY